MHKPRWVLAPLAAGALLAAVAAAQAQQPRATAAPEFKPRLSTLIQGRCHMDVCNWFSIEKADYLGAGEKGWLFAVTSRWWRSEHPNGAYDRRTPRSDAGEQTSWVFCSKTQPALIEKDGDRFITTALAPGDRDRLAGALVTGLTFYYAVCHNVAVDDVFRAAGDLARRLGYPAKAPERELSVAAPEDALRW